MSINKERLKHVITRAITSISRVSSLTGAIMRSLGIITESIDVTIMPVGRTLVNIYEGKFPAWERLVHFTIIFTKVQGRRTEEKQLYLQRFDLHYNIKLSSFSSYMKKQR